MFCCTFWRGGSKGAFSLLFMWFSQGSGPRSARAGVVETQFLIFGAACKKVSFLQQVFAHFWYIWRRNPLKRYFKIELENRSCKSVLVLFFGSILASFWTPYGASFRASGVLVPSKKQGFLEPGALDSQKLVSRLVWAHISRFLESVGRLEPFRKTTI